MGVYEETDARCALGKSERGTGGPRRPLRNIMPREKGSSAAAAQRRLSSVFLPLAYRAVHRVGEREERERTAGWEEEEERRSPRMHAATRRFDFLGGRGEGFFFCEGGWGFGGEVKWKICRGALCGFLRCVVVWM